MDRNWKLLGTFAEFRPEQLQFDVLSVEGRYWQKGNHTGFFWLHVRKELDICRNTKSEAISTQLPVTLQEISLRAPGCDGFGVTMGRRETAPASSDA